MTVKGLEMYSKEIIPETELDVFAKLRVTEALRALLSVDNLEEFSAPILDKAQTRKYLDNIERLDGQSEAHARNIANEVISDMEIATHYPPEVSEKSTGAAMADIVDDVVNHISLRKKTAATEDKSESGDKE